MTAVLKVGLNEESQAIWQRDNLEPLRYEYEVSPNDLIVDIGAYRGEWSEEMYKRFQCRIIAIEPTPHILGFPHGMVINKAAATYNGALKFGGQYYYSSSFEPGDTVYKCFDINQLLAQLPEIAVCKINIEGAEYDLLDHMIAAGHHNRIKNLQVQFHLIEGVNTNARYLKIAEALQVTHQVNWGFPFCWENWIRNNYA